MIGTYFVTENSAINNGKTDVRYRWPYLKARETIEMATDSFGLYHAYNIEEQV